MIVEIPDDVAAAIELLIDNNSEYISPALLRSVLYVISGKISGPSDLSFTAEAPLYYDVFTNKFTISQASASTDGFLSKEDFINFNGSFPLPKIQFTADGSTDTFNLGSFSSVKAVFWNSVILNDSDWSQVDNNLILTFTPDSGTIIKPI